MVNMEGRLAEIRKRAAGRKSGGGPAGELVPGRRERKRRAQEMGKDRKNTAEKKAAMSSYAEKKIMFLGIRNKIMLCFLVPILFMIVIGVLSYQKASQGMSEKYQDATMQSMCTATEYIDLGCDFVSAEALKYATNSELELYFLGLSGNDSSGLAQLRESYKNDMAAAQLGNSFISNIHIITTEGVAMFSTRGGSNMDGFYDDYIKEITGGGNQATGWIDSHPLLDERLNLNASSDRYILACQRQSRANKACVVVDVSEKAVADFLGTMNLGEGSILGFVTPGGRELIFENPEEDSAVVRRDGEKVFYGQDFFTQIRAEEGLNGLRRVPYEGEEYLFLYSVSEMTGAAVCALVPMKVVIGQAQEIKNMTFGLVILASVVALAVGLFIVSGIQNNMKHISEKLGEVAQGDLTVRVTAKSRDEFRSLAGSAANMISNTKNLVEKVKYAIDQLEDSAREVGRASDVINDYSHNITEAVSGIHEGMSRQSVHAQECVDKTDVLSNEIQSVGQTVEEVEKLIGEAEDMIDQGTEIVEMLGERAEASTKITEKVGTSIVSLQSTSESINSFVGIITEISEQTNLLSLNASIEAARAGDAGRGFAVVAEEIRKLADDSARAAGEIRNNVKFISEQTMDSVENANRAKEMVALQTQAVEQVVVVFDKMHERMGVLVDGLRRIADGTERADKERSDAVGAVRNISDIIGETAGSAETVKGVADKLLENVENLNVTAEMLGENMDSLKAEISVFKV